MPEGLTVHVPQSIMKRSVALRFTFVRCVCVCARARDCVRVIVSVCARARDCVCVIVSLGFRV